MLHSLKVQNSEQKDENPVNRGTQYKVHWLLGNFNLSRSPNAFSPEVELDASGIYIEESEWAQFFHFLLRYKITPKKNTLPNTNVEPKSDPVKNETSLQTIHFKVPRSFLPACKGQASSPPTKTTSSKFKQWESYTRNHILPP